MGFFVSESKKQNRQFWSQHNALIWEVRETKTVKTWTGPVKVRGTIKHTGTKHDAIKKFQRKYDWSVMPTVELIKDNPNKHHHSIASHYKSSIRHRNY